MRNNKMKGFTLVELLVVIAILAILATVSVVGYTSYIESTTITVDNDLANQLNHLLEAYKVNFREDIDESNIKEVTSAILSEGGLDSLVPKSLNSGYHFYYDLQEGKYVLLDDEKSGIKTAGYKALLFFMGVEAADPVSFGVRPENSFTEGNRYFLVETDTDLSNIMDKFYDIVNDEGAGEVDGAKTAAEKYLALRDAVATLGNYKLQNYFDNLIILGQGTNYASTYDATYVLLSDNVTSIGNTTQVFVGNATKPSSETHSSSNPVATVANRVTVKIGKDVNVAANGLNIAGSNVVIIVDAKDFNDLKLDTKYTLDANFTNNSTKIVFANGTSYACDENLIYSYGYAAGDDHVLELPYKNPMVSFNIAANKVVNKVTDTITAGFVAWDVADGQFTVQIQSPKGVHENEAISTTDVTWSVGAGFENYLEVVDAEKGIFEFKNHDKSAPEIDTLTVVATPVISSDGTSSGAFGGTKTPITYTVKLVRAVNVNGLTLDGKEVDFVSTIALLNGEKNGNAVTNSTFDLGGTVKIRFNHTDAEGTIVLDDATLALQKNATFNVSDDGKSLTLVNTLSDLLKAEKITLNVGKYFTKEISISMFNQYLLTFWENTDNTKIQLVGDDNPITLADLFKHNAAMELPANAQVWFFTDFGGSSDMPGDLDMTNQTSYSSRYADRIEKLAATWGTTSVQFKNGEDNSDDGKDVVGVAIVVPTADGGYRRISPVRTIGVVDGYNIRTGEFATLKEKSDAGNSIVLLGDVAPSADHAYFKILAGKTFYGNCFTLDLSTYGYMGGVSEIGSNGNIGYGIIALSGTLQDTKIIGKVYGTFAGSANDKFGTNLVAAVNGAIIKNCYLSNTRAPLSIAGGGTVTVEGTVLFGGVYANVDMRDGHLLIKGNVTTVQQVVQGLNSNNETVNVIGMGIAGWFEDQAHAVTVENGANFKQLNFISEGVKDYMPTLNYSGVNLLDTKEPFNKLFSEDEYSKYIFSNKVGETTTRYAHAGVVGLDKYLFNYAVNAEYTDGLLGKYLANNANVSIVIKPLSLGGNTEDVQVTISYDKEFYKAPDGTQTGTYTATIPVTGTTLVFKADTSDLISGYNPAKWKIWEWMKNSLLGVDMGFTITSTDKTSYSSMQFTDNSGTNAKTYARVEYKYNMGGLLSALADKVGNLHAKGLHSQNVIIDVNTYQAQKADGTNNTANYALLQEYLDAVKNNTYLNYTLTAD